MIKYQRISGVSLSEETGLPKITQTPEGLAMGSIPGWAYLLHPDYVDISLQRVRDIANPDSFSTMRSGTLSTQDVAGNPLIDASDTAPDAPVSLNTSLDVNPDEYSVFAVFDSLENRDSIQAHNLIGEVATSNTEETTLNLGITSTGSNLVVYNRSLVPASGNRISYTGNFDQRSSPSLVMMTFSVSRGLRLFDGGEQVSAEPNDTQPLTRTSPESVSHFRNARLLSGPIGVLNIDLSAPENTGHRRAIEKFLMGKYGIPEGPQ